MTRSNPYSVDLISKSGGKLPGIQRLGEHYGFTLDQVMCFGDSENDLTMISGVGYGIAMGNAVPEVKILRLILQIPIIKMESPKH